jgi:hypothetical protein
MSELVSQGGYRPVGFNYDAGLDIIPGHHDKGAFECARVRNGEVLGFHQHAVHPDDVEIEGAITPAFVTFASVVLLNSRQLGQ